MVFSSLIFLYLFLPLTLILYFSSPLKYRNYVLLLASLLFYAWGELGYVLLMIISISMNWVAGLGIDAKKRQGKNTIPVLAIAISLNLAPLVFFKYGNFIVDNLNKLLSSISLPIFELGALHLPIGISFFTFQAISYLIDINRNEAKVQKHPINLALYISLFPQLIAGPIVRYRDVAKEINSRVTRLDDLKSGTLRFVAGLGKKVLIANSMGAVADQVFALPTESVSTGLAWIGIIAYTLQIYFDFSGYSDMAIGLGRIFGFHFLENFNYPYISRSIQEFWRRWHISLSSWFRDYLYIPLGGSRAGNWRTYFNLLLVFFLCGLWHGASWTFVIWGLYHGLFLMIERIGLARLLKRLPFFIQHLYAMLVVTVGWVFFRAETIDQALQYIVRLFDFNSVIYLNAKLFAAMNNQFYLTLIVGLILCTPLVRDVLIKLDNSKLFSANSGLGMAISKELLISVWMVAVVLVSTAQMITSGYNPFLYFRF